MPRILSPVEKRRKRRLFELTCAAALLVCGIGTIQASTAANGGYARDQAAAGKLVYTGHCSRCHGAQLQGQAGPPLAGSGFASNLQYSKISAQQLFDFIKRHMPNNAPGSLTNKQYQEVFAYILSENGYPAGSNPLTGKSVSRIDLLPYPGNGSSSSTGTQSSSSR
jgi:mono/diheme cytochrome c family protein